MDQGKNELEKLRVKVLSKGCITDKTYELDDSFKRGANTAAGVHTTVELVKLLETDPNIKFDGIFICGSTKDGKAKFARLTRDKFLESYKANSRKSNFKKLCESFSRGFDYGGVPGNLVGEDYVPLLGGPFNKQLYLHDSLRMFALAFQAYNHDPIAKAVTEITVDFTLGRGYRIDSKDKVALALWKSFEKANDFTNKMRNIATELSYNGEVMLWRLPNHMPYVVYQDGKNQIPDQVILPRITLIDPSTCWEIITYPEDISRVLAYQLVFPTQYQIYTTKDKGESVPTSKFIVQQVPAEQVKHYKINCASNEKRGRSDYYPVFGFLKRLRDTVQYSVIAMQKAAAWAIDTTIEGSPADMENYIQSVNSEGSLSPAGSEFVHTDRVKREYRSNEGTQSGSISAFEWCLSMICAGVRIPVSYIGTHLSGGQTRASALVGTEPVTKKFEARQLVYTNILQDQWDELMRENKIVAECEITFPELITQDRSAKIKDLIIAKDEKAISHKYMSNVIASELGYTSYDYEVEMKQIELEAKSGILKKLQNILISPLTSTALTTSDEDDEPDASGSAVTSTEKKKISDNKGA